MIDFRGVGVELRGRKILDSCTFSLEKRKITVLLGRNGSGKTTLVNCLNGMLRYTGEICLEGRSLALIGRRELARRIAILPQRLPNTDLSVKSLVALGRNPYVDAVGRLNEYDRSVVSCAMADAGVGSFAEERVNNLSGGERQRAFLGMTLAQETDVLVMDEPTAYLDVYARRELTELIKSLARNKEKTMLVIMHDIDEALAVADNIVLLDEGRCVFSGTKERFLSGGVAEKHFGLKRYAFEENGETTIFFR